MTKTISNLERLQTWFVSQCDGDWEHSYGISISTADNPGWIVDIELLETNLVGRNFESLRIERSENDWLIVFSGPDMFKIRCGPSNLEEGLGIFCDWAEV